MRRPGEPMHVPFYGLAVVDAGREQDAGTDVDASEGARPTVA